MKKSTQTVATCHAYKPLPRCRRRSSLDFTGIPTRTKQSFKDECDINSIMKKYQRTGVIDHVNKHGGVYGECPAATFQEALALVDQAHNQFSELPSEARRRFNNDPAAFLSFVEDDNNREEAVLLGLIDAPKADTVAAPVPPAQAEPAPAE